MITIKIYTLTNPITNTVFYVGRTISPLKYRLRDHIQESKSKVKSKKNALIGLLATFGKTPIIEEIETIECNLASDEILANDIENYWIQQFTAWGFPLCNAHGVRIIYKNKPLLKLHTKPPNQ